MLYVAVGIPRYLSVCIIRISVYISLLLSFSNVRGIRTATISRALYNSHAQENFLILSFRLSVLIIFHLSLSELLNDIEFILEPEGLLLGVVLLAHGELGPELLRAHRQVERVAAAVCRASRRCRHHRDGILAEANAAGAAAAR